MAGNFMANTDSMRDIFRGLNNNVSEFENKEQQLYGIVDNLSSSWIGADSKSYVEKISEFKPTIDELAQNIEEFAKIIDANAASIDEMVANISSAFKG